jgi:hypothetical protein
LTAGAVRKEGAYSVETINERTDREIPPDEAGIETDRIRGEQAFQTREPPPNLRTNKPLVAERLGEPFEKAPDKGGIKTVRI